MTAIPRYRKQEGPAILAVGFRPFFLGAAVWAALAIPLWLTMYSGGMALPSALPPAIWHVHEMVFGFGAATIAGFLLTAIPNWTGRMPLQGAPLAGLVVLWAAGRVGGLLSGAIGASSGAALDLVFPIVFLAVVAREILAGRNLRNLPMLAALTLFLAGNFLVHLDALGLAATAGLGNRIGIATLLMLIAMVGGRIIPSFTRNWLANAFPDAPAPAAFGRIDGAALAVTALTLAFWVAEPEAPATAWLALAAGALLAIRLLRWQGLATFREPLVCILHLGYGWLALGFLLLALVQWLPALPPTTALHALTIGAIGTMTLAVMTRASLGHTGRQLTAGTGTTTIYVLVTLAAVLRIAAPLGGEQYVVILALAGAAWSGAFSLFALLYLRPLAFPPVKGLDARAI